MYLKQRLDVVLIVLEINLYCYIYTIESACAAYGCSSLFQ